MSTDFRMAWLFPGEGNMPKSPRCLLRRSPRFRDYLALVQRHVSVELERYLQQDANQWPDFGAHIAHPIITAAMCAQIDSLRYDGHLPDLVAGHGLGELCAIYAAGVLDAESLLQLACLRGELLTTVVGTSLLLVSQRKRLSIEEVLENVVEGLVFQSVAVSRNRLIVAADRRGLASLTAGLPEHIDASIIPGCGPWYCPMVGGAAITFSEALEDTRFSDPTCDVIMSSTGRTERNAAEIRSTLQRQLTSPALWGNCIDHLVAEGYRHFLDVSVCHGRESTLVSNLPEFLDCSVIGPPAFDRAEPPGAH